MNEYNHDSYWEQSLSRQVRKIINDPNDRYATHTTILRQTASKTSDPSIGKQLQHDKNQYKHLRHHQVKGNHMQTGSRRKFYRKKIKSGFKYRQPIYVETKNLVGFYSSKISQLQPNISKFKTIRDLRKKLLKKDEFKKIYHSYFASHLPIKDIMTSDRLLNRRSGIKHIGSVLKGLREIENFHKIKGVTP